MSLDKKYELSQIAKTVCRDLRKNSTKSEIILWEAIRNKKFNNRKFYRQHPIYYDLLGVESFFIADFYCHELNLVIEVDGLIHKYRLTEDIKRTEILNKLGLNVIRFTNEDINNKLDDVKEKLKNILS